MKRLDNYSSDGRSRVLIEAVSPRVDGGRFPVKRVVGDVVEVRARIFTDGHDLIQARLKFRHGDEASWTECFLSPEPNDWWRGCFEVARLGAYRFSIEAWIDRFGSWRRDLMKRLDAGQLVEVELLIGAAIVREHSSVTPAPDRAQLQSLAEQMESAAPIDERIAAALSETLASLMGQHADRRHAACGEQEWPVIVDRPKARFSTWYELFPRSCSPTPGRHGTLRDCLELLPEIAEMGFDVMYLPPIHPIGRAFRKGKNNSVTALADDVGSPWAIGAAEGGHKAIHPGLGTLGDFHELVARGAECGVEIALDIAFQCAPDHPYVAAHPEWFRQRPDGTVQYAENPPKKYQDIYPFDFESSDWQGLWHELLSVMLYWCEQGVRIFRVDNPHTKSIRFWEWVIAEVKRSYPETIFLSEAFTRPVVTQSLAKVGFTQSYTYFTWRNTKAELTEYFTELTRPPICEFFRPNLWPNTPDILSEYLQFGGRPAFMARYVLAATLGASCGIYGPAFELCENKPREAGSEEYLDSEKYQLRRWSRDVPHSLRHYIARINRIRQENSALHSDERLQFHAVDNDQLLCYSKRTKDLTNIIVTVVNLDPRHRQSGWVDLPLAEFGIDSAQAFQAHDLLGDGRFLWHGTRNYVELDPQTSPAQIFALRRRLRTEAQFEYFL